MVVAVAVGHLLGPNQQLVVQVDIAAVVLLPIRNPSASLLNFLSLAKCHSSTRKHLDSSLSLVFREDSLEPEANRHLVHFLKPATVEQSRDPNQVLARSQREAVMVDIVDRVQRPDHNRSAQEVTTVVKPALDPTLDHNRFLVGRDTWHKVDTVRDT